MIKSLKAFVSNKLGATAIEYALIASLIAVALVTVLTSLGTNSAASSPKSAASSNKTRTAKNISALARLGPRQRCFDQFRQMLIHPGRLST